MKKDGVLSYDVAYDNMFAILADYYPLSDSFRELLYKNSNAFCFIKDDLLLAEDKDCNMMYFIVDGLCSGFYNKDGKEWITNFFCENEFCSSWFSFLGGGKSFISIKAMKVTYAIGISREDLNILQSAGPEFVYIMNEVLKKFIASNEVRAYVMRSNPAKERILHYMDTHEIYYLMKYVPQYSIASFLNMTPEVFSRLMKEIKEGR